MQVVDSADVRLVQHGPLVGLPPTLRLTAEPVWRTGWAPADTAVGYPVGGVLLTDGGAAIGDAYKHALIVFGPSGQFRRLLGEEGAGPGEIRSFQTVTRIGLDTIVVEDDRNARISLFSPDTFLASVPVGTVAGMGTLMIGGVWGNELVVRSAAYNNNVAQSWIPGVVARLNLETLALDTLRSFPFGRSQRAVLANPFVGSGRVGVTSGAILVARGDLPRLEWVAGDGRVFQVARWSDPRPTLTEEDWADYGDGIMSDPVITLDADARRDRFASLRAPIGVELPYLFHLVGDDQGNAWVGSFSTNWRVTRRFKVFGPAGEFLSNVEMPPRFQVLDIRDGRVLGIEYNVWGAAAAAVYRLEPLD